MELSWEWKSVSKKSNQLLQSTYWYNDLRECNWDRIPNYQMARDPCSRRRGRTWPVLKAFCARSLISKALMVIQRNTLRTPGGTRIRPAIPDGVIFQYKCTRKALTILGILRCGQSILRGDVMRSAICCYYYFSLEKKNTYFWFLYFCISQLCSMIHHHNCIFSNTNCLFLGWCMLHPSETQLSSFYMSTPQGLNIAEKKSLKPTESTLPKSFKKLIFTLFQKNKTKN